MTLVEEGGERLGENILLLLTFVMHIIIYLINTKWVDERGVGIISETFGDYLMEYDERHPALKQSQTD